MARLDGHMIRTRLAPTPSGLLHIGNAWSFVLTWLAARRDPTSPTAAGRGRIHLRIDDLDAARAQDAFLEDIFASLRWLGIDWDTGPRDVAEFKAAHSQRLRLDRYRAAAENLKTHGTVYACDCSRAQIRLSGTVYPGTCRDRGLDFDQADHAMRFQVPSSAVSVRDADGGAFALHPARDPGDFVVVRRDGDPAYHLASVIDDTDLGVNFIVRGLDLVPSTGAQIALAAALDLKEFGQARFWHHPLVLDDTGAKLSKSLGAESLAALRDRFPDPAPVLRWFAQALGKETQGVHTIRDLLQGFDPVRISTNPLQLSDFWKFIEAEVTDR
jgi:glutamyl-tRNA synthetase